MAKVEIAQTLAGRLLIAMPGPGDTRFQRSVILICAHSADGAMGLIINKPVVDMSFQGLLEQLNIRPSARGRDIRVRFGGPVERGRGFVLHSADWQGEDLALEVPGGLRMTATLDILRALAGGEGPRQALLALGYSGWGPGQLEAEILRNDWLICDPAQAAAPDLLFSDLVFSDADPGKWGGALRLMGVDPVTLSGVAGRA